MAPSIGDYDQVVAITQQMINNALQDLFAIHESSAGDTTIPSFGPPNYSFKEFKLGCPRVVVHYSDEDKYHVMYQIRILSGKFATQKDWDSTEVLTWPIENWIFSYVVNIALADVDSKMADDLRAKHNIPGDYSIQKLIMDMKDTDISKSAPGESFFGGYEKSKEPKLSDDNLRNIKELMTTIGSGGKGMSKLQLADLKTLGYITNGGPNQNVVNSPTATFVPCGVQFQTYPYMSNNNRAGDGTSGNSRLNYLCYLEKTLNPGDPKEPDMPDKEKKYLNPDGNWTSGSISSSNGVDNIPDDLPLGTFVMTSRNFMGQYLLPKLRDIIARMSIAWSDLWTDAWANSTWGMAINFHINDPGNVTDQDWSTKWSKSQNGKDTIWKFKKDWPWDEKHGKGAQQTKVGAEAFNEVTVTATTDSPVIKVSGFAYIRLYSEVWWGIEGHAKSSADDLHRTFRWSFNLNLQSVNDGGLQITMTDRKHKIDYSSDDKRDLKDKFGGIMDAIEKWWNDFNFGNLGDLENVLAQDIGRASKLVFPCSGAFFYKNPVMTDKGDLMCTVGYKPSGQSFEGPPRANPQVLPEMGKKNFNEKKETWT
ncbi:hypothetical protein ABEF92_007400 [Exophiala dermatitidis]|uniref:Uncharacterized protein n=1 Tax=Exophiala dermatitidis (strain ATCC 34100 / CBS 525.76 / NIH/UT8656) TaxID=858893 RepID=H6BZU7_EXODN|nr:uncharacterized protein HMPREF1120_04369 [Exophiala dermatitidis NIH/UT8656]EHY56282.1 hypothetical protein HMPREF1120_04369 [Exophiala dermatitidis NIH/UT8656]